MRFPVVSQHVFFLNRIRELRDEQGVFTGGGGGHWAMVPLWPKIFFFNIETKMENLVGPLLCMNTSGQRKFGPFSKSWIRHWRWIYELRLLNYICSNFTNCNPWCSATAFELMRKIWWIEQRCPRVTFLGPDTNRPGETLTRPAIAGKKSDPTRSDPRPDPSPYVHSLIEKLFINYFIIIISNIVENKSIRM